MRAKPLPVEQVLTMLAATPSRIATLTAGLGTSQLRTAPSPDEWSANAVLAHLRSCADVWGNCIATMMAYDRPTLRAVDPRTWITKTNYLEQEFQTSLHTFALQRTDLLAVLESLPHDAWARGATVTGAGRPLERTILSYAQRLARHERPHIKQIERIVKAMHK